MTHASELVLFFGEFPAVEQALAEQMMDFYVNFVNDLNPGGVLRDSDRASRQHLQSCASSVAAVHFADEASPPADEGQHHGYP